MRDVTETLNEHIESFAPLRAEGAGTFTELSKRWASHCLETYRDDLLSKGLGVSKALVEFEIELLQRDANA